MTTPTPADRTARLNMRVSPEAQATIREAAAAQQQDVTSFVLGAALERARAVLLEERVLRMTPAELAQVESDLDREPRVIPELAALVREVRGSRRGSTAVVPVATR
ncbi:MAG TPA: DUF1778 domain-containing protein [Actinotalea sp.]|nr:DUF1778 domain-containing protein [Actinotalea sp.]